MRVYTTTDDDSSDSREVNSEEEGGRTSNDLEDGIGASSARSSEDRSVRIRVEVERNGSVGLGLL